MVGIKKQVENSAAGDSGKIGQFELEKKRWGLNVDRTVDSDVDPSRGQ